MSYVSRVRPPAQAGGRGVAMTFAVAEAYYSGDGEPEEVFDYLNDHFIDLVDDDDAPGMVTVEVVDDGRLLVHVHQPADVDRVERELGPLTEGGW